MAKTMDPETTTTQTSSLEMTTVGRLLTEFRYGVEPKHSKPIPHTPDWLLDTVVFVENLLAKVRMRYAASPTPEDLEWGRKLRQQLDDLKEMAAHGPTR